MYYYCPICNRKYHESKLHKERIPDLIMTRAGLVISNNPNDFFFVLKCPYGHVVAWQLR